VDIGGFGWIKGDNEGIPKIVGEFRSSRFRSFRSL